MKFFLIAADSGINLKDHLEADLEFSGANRSLIFSMFYNVVNNAVKNTASKGIVTVSSSFFAEKD